MQAGPIADDYSKTNAHIFSCLTVVLDSNTKFTAQPNVPWITNLFLATTCRPVLLLIHSVQSKSLHSMESMEYLLYVLELTHFTSSENAYHLTPISMALI